ncbi:MAG: hypothetical protein QT05_C0008G0021 [archaeon GW2011_AR13]|nr:MAG: hypothetical protein QT05_C0008G0021 [archaeon GW2011_AR13]HIG95045.1 hypothetical protein [Nanoarchaeota archaeon]HIH62751.1 hypothetical protein [Nanoarchaeota archaeon]HIJ10007.1 hypothetical protein [Nanoarchaeota archaeon]
MANKNLKLDYWQDLALGEKAVKDFLAGKPLDYIAKNDAVYLNRREVAFGLNVTDLAIAKELARLNGLYLGDSGTGKSQLAQDFYNYYYGGNAKDGGEALKIRGYQLTERTLSELVFEELNLERARWDLTDNVKSVYYLVDEINRAPTVKQNDCFELGDGLLNHNGSDVKIGREGFYVMTATANIGNGEFGGTFDVDKAMYNRLAIAIDFDYEGFLPTKEDKMILDEIRGANPDIKHSPKKNIVDKLILAEREIDRATTNFGIEEKAILGFLKNALMNCSVHDRTKKAKWDIQNRFCQDCSLNVKVPAEFPICSMINSPVQRTIEATKKYAAALEFLAKLKNPERQLNSTDLMFKAFEFTGAYQSLLNPMILTGKYYSENPKMIADVVSKLKEDFNKNKDRIMTTLHSAENGMNHRNLFYIKMPSTKVEGVLDNYSDLAKNKEILKIDKNAKVDRDSYVFDDKGVLGYSWVETQGDVIKDAKKAKDIREKGSLEKKELLK